MYLTGRVYKAKILLNTIQDTANEKYGSYKLQERKEAVEKGGVVIIYCVR